MELELVTETEVEELTEEVFEFVELTPEPEPELESEPEPAPVTFFIPDPKPVPAARRRNVPRFTQMK